MNWKQEDRYSAKGESGKFYKVFPFINPSDKFGATVTYLSEDGELRTDPIGSQWDSVEEAKNACEKEFTKRAAK